MIRRLKFFLIFFMALGLLSPAVAGADKTGKKINAKVTEAMESYDLMEFESAKKLLEEAIEIAEKNAYEGEEVAHAFMSLGIVYFSGLEDKEAAREAFEAAVELSSSIEVDVAYRTPEITSILDELRGGKGNASSSDGGAGCEAIEGLVHELIEDAARGRSRKVTASASDELGAAGVSIYYRSKGEIQFTEVKLQKTGACEYTGEIPAKAVTEDFLHYYLAAVDSGGKAIESKGTSGSPNIIEVADADGEDPLMEDPDEDIEDSVLLEKTSSVYLSIAVGGGSGFVNGPTEKTKSPVQCCMAAAYFHLLPEIGYYLTRQMAISAAFRMGFPVTANVTGHATFAPAGLLRLRYVLDESGEGIEVSGAAGFGLIRNTVPILNATDETMDTDTTSMGPVLVGAGLGYNTSLGGPMRLVAEVNAIAGIPGMFASAVQADPKFGLQFDGNLAVLFAF